jgi:hypothetical protein
MDKRPMYTDCIECSIRQLVPFENLWNMVLDSYQTGNFEYYYTCKHCGAKIFAKYFTPNNHILGDLFVVTEKELEEAEGEEKNVNS